MDIDLNDPEAAEAATKIQAGFRGMKSRNETKEKKAAAVTAPAKAFEAKALWEQKAASADHIHEEHALVTRRRSITEETQELHAKRGSITSPPKAYTEIAGGKKP